MLHTKFQCNRTSGSGEEDIFQVFTIYGRVGHIGHVIWTKYINFLRLLLGGCIGNLNEIGPVVLEEKPFENVNRQRRVTTGQGH